MHKDEARDNYKTQLKYIGNNNMHNHVFLSSLYTGLSKGKRKERTDSILGNAMLTGSISSCSIPSCLVLFISKKLRVLPPSTNTYILWFPKEVVNARVWSSLCFSGLWTAVRVINVPLCSLFLVNFLVQFHFFIIYGRTIILISCLFFSHQMKL